jgi:type I restriction enzyme, S subunit
VTKNKNFLRQEQRFKERVASEDTTNYWLVPPQHFAYRPPGVNVGYICFNNKPEIGCVTSYYPVFKVKEQARIIPEYLYCVFQSENFREQADAFFRGTARPSISFTDFCQIKVPVPPLKEQARIIEKLAEIEKNIAEAQQIITKLNSRHHISELWPSEKKEFFKITDFIKNNCD